MEIFSYYRANQMEAFTAVSVSCRLSHYALHGVLFVYRGRLLSNILSQKLFIVFA